MNFEFSLDARLDLFAAQDHYEGEREGLGLEFIAEMEQIAHKIAARPLRFPAIGDAGARRALGKRFPYFLAFFVLEDRVRIVAVMHQHQHPDIWKARS